MLSLTPMMKDQARKSALLETAAFLVTRVRNANQDENLPERYESEIQFLDEIANQLMEIAALHQDEEGTTA